MLAVPALPCSAQPAGQNNEGCESRCSEGRTFRIRILSEVRLILRSAGGARIMSVSGSESVMSPPGCNAALFRGSWLPHLALKRTPEYSPYILLGNLNLVGGGHCSKSSEDGCLPGMLPLLLKISKIVSARHFFEGLVSKGPIVRRISTAFHSEA